MEEKGREKEEDSEIDATFRALQIPNELVAAYLLVIKRTLLTPIEHIL